MPHCAKTSLCGNCNPCSCRCEACSKMPMDRERCEFSLDRERWLREVVEPRVLKETGGDNPDDGGCAGCLTASKEFPCLGHGCTAWCRRHYQEWAESDE